MIAPFSGYGLPKEQARPQALLERVIHIKLDRVRSHTESRHLVHLQVDIGINHGVAEDSTTGKKLTVLVERLQGHVER